MDRMMKKPKGGMGMGGKRGTGRMRPKVWI